MPINDERNGELMRVPINLKQCVWVVAMTLAIGITGGTLQGGGLSVGTPPDKRPATSPGLFKK